MCDDADCGDCGDCDCCGDCCFDNDIFCCCSSGESGGNDNNNSLLYCLCAGCLLCPLFFVPAAKKEEETSPTTGTVAPNAVNDEVTIAATAISSQESAIYPTTKNSGGDVIPSSVAMTTTALPIESTSPMQRI